MTPKRLLRTVAVSALTAFVLAGCGETTETLFVDTTAPSAPTNLAVDRDNESLAVTWDPNSEPDLAGYVLERSEDGETWEAVSGVLTESTYEDALHNTVDYRVRAVDLSENYSAYSDTAHFLAPPPDGEGKSPANPA